MAKTFTFKTHKPTGRYRSFDNSYHEIKIDGRVVGSIDDAKPHKARFMVHKDEKDREDDKNPNCPWKWVTLKHEAETIDEQKTWLKENFELITSKLKIYQE